LPRGAKRHAVLINSATATPRKIYRGFAGYLARRGCAVLTYDYRGTGDSRSKAPAGDDQPKSLVGFNISMSDWAALDITARGHLDARTLSCPAARLCRPFLRRPGPRAYRQQHRGFARAVDRSPGRLLEADGLAGTLPGLCLLNFVGHPLTRLLGYAPGWSGLGQDLPKGVFEQWVRWVMSPGYLFDDATLGGLKNFPHYKGAMRALGFSDDPWTTTPAVELLCSGFTSIQPEILTVTPADAGAAKIGHLGFFRGEYRDTLWRGAAEWIQAGEFN
jgi:predicted alpha/beta hydrolase